MAKTEYKVIPMDMRDEFNANWERALNEAAAQGWELVSTPATATVVYAVMRKGSRGTASVIPL